MFQDPKVCDFYIHFRELVQCVWDVGWGLLRNSAGCCCCFHCQTYCKPVSGGFELCLPLSGLRSRRISSRKTQSGIRGRGGFEGELIHVGRDSPSFLLVIGLGWVDGGYLKLRLLSEMWICLKKSTSAMQFIRTPLIPATASTRINLATPPVNNLWLIFLPLSGDHTCTRCVPVSL